MHTRTCIHSHEKRRLRGLTVSTLLVPDEIRVYRRRVMVIPISGFIYVAYSGHTLDGQALTNSCTLCYVR